ncbi:lactadherin-like [Sinocyclocheilus rhinocerous]|uniref:lactadherin-like n=1 Tax=Sinocyclocheilus rhinocerous TaxID=307959 RepID=UPI0007BA322A|nr:PREDICTED: lactadherin-like [Sinocyclocheilus rhinocerous]
MDNDGTKTNLFDPPIIAQYMRIIPVVCRKACTLRIELVGCELNGCPSQHASHTAGSRLSALHTHPITHSILPLTCMKLAQR